MSDNQFPGFNNNVIVPVNDNRLVSQPAICAHLASRCYVFRKKRPQGICRSIWDARKPDSANTFRLSCKNRNIFDSNSHDYLIIRSTAPLSRSFAADVRLINLHRSQQLFAPGTHHCTPEPVKPLPGSVVAAKPKNSLQTECVCPIFLIGNMPHSLKPQPQRLSSLMEDGSGSYRDLVSTLLAKGRSPGHLPPAGSATFGALKTIRPSKGSQVSDACFFRGEAVPEFRQSARIVFHTQILHVVFG